MLSFTSQVKSFLAKTSVKTYAILALIAVAILIIVALVFYAKKAAKLKILYDTQVSINTQNEAQYTNKIGEKVSEVHVWTLKYTTLEAAHEKALKDRSVLEVQLAKAYDDIKLANAKIRKGQEYYQSLLTSKDTTYEMLLGDYHLLPIHKKFYDIDFIYKDTLVKIVHKYHTGQSIVVSIFPKRKANGKKHFPNWGNLPWVGWDNTSIWTVEDTDAEITNQIAVRFTK